MKALGYRTLLLMVVVGSALVFLAFTGAGSVSPALVGSETTKTNRKLKENSYHHPIGSTKKKRDSGNINLEDYSRVDPPPISKADPESGLIEHGTPLMPHIPQPTPPGPPKDFGSP